jgi:hypothetical protein
MGNPIIKASEFNVKKWIDANGNIIELLKLSDFAGKFKVVYCFQFGVPDVIARDFLI